MTAFALLKLVTAATSLYMGAAIVSRDPGLRANRLSGGVAFCTAWWAACEVSSTVQQDAESAVFFLRGASVGWLLIGPLFFDLASELAGERRLWATRTKSVLYICALLLMPFYLGSGRFIARVTPAAWGWSSEYGPLSALVDLYLMVPALFVMVFWPRIRVDHESFGQRRAARVAFFSIGVAVTVTALTDVAPPSLGIRSIPPLGSSALTMAEVVVALYLRRYGHSLLSSKAFALEILDTLRDGVVLLRPNARVIACNAAFEHLSGVPSARLQGERIDDRLASFSLDLSGRWGEIEQRGDLGRRGQVGRRGEVESVLLTDSGARVPVLVSRPILCRSGSRLTGVALLVRDLSEVVDLRDHLLTSAKLAAMGTLAAAIAEGIASPGADARAALLGLRRDWHALTDEADARPVCPEQIEELLKEGGELIEESLEGAERIADIVRDVHELAHPDSAVRETFSVGEVVESALRMAPANVGAGVETIFHNSEDALVIGHRGELEQVVLNLLVNALQALETKRSNEPREWMPRVRVLVEMRDRRVLVHVEDNGCGIEPESMDRIFDPFFTTKDVGVGTGLGLAICHQIVQAHDGVLRVATSPGNGTTFTLDLPAAEG